MTYSQAIEESVNKSIFKISNVSIVCFNIKRTIISYFLLMIIL